MSANDTEVITSLSYAYARALDVFDSKTALDVFTPDCIWDASALGLKRIENRDEFITFLEAGAEHVAKQGHVFTNQLIEFENQDLATGSNYASAAVELKDGTVHRSLVRNDDRYVRTADGWKIAERTLNPIV